MQLVTYIISLQRAVERRRHIVETYLYFAEKPKVIDAIDARDFTPEQIEEIIEPTRRDWKNYLRSGAVCCALSHLKAYHEFLESGDEWCLVMEDDAKLMVSKVRYEEVLSNLIQTDFDVICLNSFSPTKTELKLAPDKSGIVNIFIPANSKSPGSGLAYVLRRNAAESIIKYQNPIRDTADAWQNFIDGIGLRIGFVKPDIFEPYNFKSTIEYTYDIKFVNKLMPKWLKNLRRWLIQKRMKKNVVLK